jgi:sugar/nucleoside kinase (ribokinase family)
MDVIVVGNVTLDVICFPVEDVPRYDSIAFDHSAVGPGGCGSNVAIGLAASGIGVGLVACVGGDDAGRLIQSYWARWGIDLTYLRTCNDSSTAISVGLVDKKFQPRFIHTPGANSSLTAADILPFAFKEAGVKILCVAGYFVLPGLLDGGLGEALANAQRIGITTVLDVVHSPRMGQPESLWSVLPGLDVFLCNSQEAMRITQTDNYFDAAADLQRRGAKNVVVKLGAQGCSLFSGNSHLHLAGEAVKQVVDTTGAGDAFAAGLVSAMVHGKDLPAACIAGNLAGARIVAEMGAISAWGYPESGL